jgi:hypothetical protein
MADYPDYAARAVRAEQAYSPEIYDRWRNVARSYWALARQHTEMMNRRRQKQKPTWLQGRRAEPIQGSPIFRNNFAPDLGTGQRRPKSPPLLQRQI